MNKLYTNDVEIQLAMSSIMEDDKWATLMWIGRHEIEFLHNTSLYYNNRFAFHMHIFNVSILIIHMFYNAIH